MYPVLLNAGLTKHDGTWNYKDVLSPFTRIHYVVKGTAKIVREDSETTIREGHLYLTPAYVKHSYVNDSFLELYYLHIYFDPREDTGLFEMKDLPPEAKAEAADRNLFERLIKINPNCSLSDFDPKVYDNDRTLGMNLAEGHKRGMAETLETEGIIKQLLSRFLVSQSDPRERIDPRIVKAIQYINSHIESNTSLDELASLAAISKDHFIRLFDKEMHITPRKYINRKKIEAAQLRIVLNGNESIKNIAYSLGFDNPQYFDKLFLKICGSTPGSYRNRCLMK